VGFGAPRLATLAAEARRARNVAVGAEALLTGLLKAETGQRGYLLTGDISYLAPYRQAAVTLTEALAAIATLQAGRPAGDPLGIVLQQLQGAATAKRDELDATLQVFVQSGLDAAAERVREGWGKRHMDDARRLVGEAQSMAGLLADRAASEAEEVLRWGGIAIIGLLAIAFASGLRGQRIGRAREELVAARTRAIVETAPLAIAMLDSGMRFLVVNTALCQVAGRSAEALRGRPLDRMMPATLVPAVQALLRTALAQPGQPAEATIAEDAGAGRDRRSWLGMARADTAKDGPGTLVLLMQDITARRAAEAERLLLIHELNHRVKNVIATVQGLANQSWTSARGDGEAFLEVFGARLRSLAGAHGLLIDSGWRHAALTEVLRVALAPWRGPTDGLTITGPAGPSPLLGPSQVLGLALVLHELATNAAKYGALSAPGGTVSVTWRREADGAVQLTWRETGGPAVAAPPTHEGFGSFLIDRAFDNDPVPGEVRRDFTADGLVATFRFTPAPDGDAAAATP
jgi:PAS domain S-box-containing protein